MKNINAIILVVCLISLSMSTYVILTGNTLHVFSNQFNPIGQEDKNDNIQTSTNIPETTPIVNKPSLDMIPVRSSIVDVLTGQIYSDKQVKVGYYESFDDGYTYRPMMNFTDDNGLHIEFSPEAGGIFYIVPVIQNNTELFIAPVTTTYNNTSFLSFDFKSLNDNGLKNWVFKVDSSYLSQSCQSGFCRYTKVPNFIIDVYSFGKPTLNNQVIENIGSTVQGDIDCIGCDSKYPSVPPTQFNIPINFADCSAVPITGMQLEMSPNNEILWRLGQSSMTFTGMPSIGLDSKDVSIFMKNKSVVYNYDFNPIVHNNKNDLLKFAYYLISECGKKVSQQPEMINHIAFALYHDSMVNANETLFYSLPNGTISNSTSKILFCESQCNMTRSNSN